jgi:hypothetical protein
MALETDMEFAQLAGERTQRHPVRSYLRIPIERAAAMWFTPRIALLPYSGTLWPLSDGWHQSRTGFEITIGFAFLNVLYAGLALIGPAHWRECPGIALIVAFILLTQSQTCEPRYVLVCFPAFLAFGAQSWHSRPWKWAHTAMPSVLSARLSTALPACGEFRTSRSRIGPDDARS